MYKIAKQLGSEAREDPSLLHPLLSRLPPLYPDTPDASNPPAKTADSTDNEDDPNPYEPIPLSQLFFLADDLAARFPWDGEVIRGKEIMGEGSVVRTYELEMTAWTRDAFGLDSAIDMLDRDVVMPGAGAADDEEEEETPAPIRRRPVRRLRLPRNKLGTGMVFSIVLVGITMAVFGFKAGGPGADWSRWWALVLRTWAGKSEKAASLVEGYGRIIGYVGRTLRDLL